MKSVLLSLFLSGIIIIGTISPIFAYIPPTVAYDNITASNGSAMAQTYDSHINFQGLRGMQVFASNNSQTIYFNATLSNGTKITPITCSSNYQLHSINSLGIFTCALNNNTGGPALDTMQNLTPAQAYVYAKNSTDFNFQFRGMNFTGSLTGSNSSNLITIHGNIYQNNTGANPGTHGIGIYSSMSGAVLQFLKLLGGQGISVTSNSTNANISTNFKVNNQTCANGYFVSAYDNKTGNYVCTQDSDPFLTSAILSINGNTNAAQTINGSGPITVVDSGSIHTVKCITCSTTSGTVNSISNIGKGGKGILAAISGGNLEGKNVTGIKNINVYANATDLKISSNNTAYAQNILSNNGISNGKGIGIYKNNTNTTMINLKSLISLNNFNTLETNSSNLILNESTPTNNVIDVYDQTIGDYSTPSSATATSACCPSTTPSSATVGSTASSTTGWNTIVTVQKFTGLQIAAQITKVGVNVVSAAGNIRVKVYADDGSGGNPSTLLAESAPTAVSSTGIFNVTLTSNAIIPASGNVWAGFETDSASLSLKYNNAGSDTQCHVAHTFGTGPSPFGTCTSGTNLDFKDYITYNTITHPSSNAVDGNTATYWESNSEVNPNIYVDTGSAQILSGAAMFWNSSSTSRQILVQTSTDASSWNTKRTINTNLLTNNAWNYIRWDIDGSTERYIRFYGNDGSAKELSFYELKALIPSSTTLLLRHGHEFISTTNATLPLNR